MLFDHFDLTRLLCVVVVVVCGALLGAFVRVFGVSGCSFGVNDPFWVRWARDAAVCWAAGRAMS